MIEYLPPIYITALRFTFALLSTLIILIAKKEFIFPKLKDIPVLIVLGITGIGLYNALIYMALEYTSAINSSLIKSINPIVTLILASIILGQKIKLKQIFGIIISVIGIVVVITKGNLKNITNFNFGDFLMIINVLLWSIYNIVSKKIEGKMNSIQTTFWATFFGLLVISPVGIMQRFELGNISVPFGVYLCIAYLGIVASSFGMIIWQKGIREVGAVTTSIIYNLIPVFTLIISVLILKEEINVLMIFGVVLALSGTMVCIKT